MQHGGDSQTLTLSDIPSMSDPPRSPQIGEPADTLLRAVYREFTRSGEWPLAWRLDAEFHDVLDPAGGLAEVCAALGGFIACGPISDPQSRVKLRLAALARLDDADGDIAAFLSLCRFVGHAYKSSPSRTARITLADFTSSSAISEPVARRAWQIALLDGHFCAGNSSTHLHLTPFAQRLVHVQTIAEFERLWDEYWNRNYRPSAVWKPARASRLPAGARYVLSHAAADTKAAQYLANLIHIADKSVTVFAASTPCYLQSGDDWMASIRAELKAADACVLLLSKQSVLRPWMWFETGAAWFHERRLIPLLMPDLSKHEVPMPLAGHQLLSLATEREVDQFFAELNLSTPGASAVVAGIRELHAANVDQRVDGPRAR